MDILLNESEISKDNLRKSEITDDQNEENNIVIDNTLKEEKITELDNNNSIIKEKKDNIISNENKENINIITNENKDNNDIITNEKKDNNNIISNENKDNVVSNESKNNNIIANENKDNNNDSEFDRSDEKSLNEENENKEINIEKKNNSEIIESINLDNLEINEGYNYYIQPFSGNIIDLNQIFSDFLLKIPEEQKIAFNIEDNITKYISGIYPKLIILKNNKGIIQGLSIISFDPLSQISKSLNLLLVCSLSNEILSNILKDIIKYITENLIYDEIRIELFYGMKNEQFYLIKDIEKSLKEDVKFKWVNMENDGIHRKIKYKYQNPNKIIDFSIIPTGKNILELKTASIVSFNNNNIDNNNLIKNNELNDFGIISIISEMISMNDYEINFDKDNSFSQLLQKIQYNKFIKITNEFIQNQFGSFEEIKEFIKDNLSNLASMINNNFIKTNLIGTSLMKIEVSFETVIQTSLDGFLYNIISNNDIEVFTYQKEDNNYFYLLHSSNENLSFIIYEFKNNKFEDLIDSDENNISEIFQNIYSKINQQPKKIMKRMYLPVFKINKSKVYNKPLFLNGIKLSNNDGDYYIQNLNQIEDFIFGIEEKKNNLINAKLNLQFIDDNKDVVIKNEFLIALINPDLLCDLQIPTISTFIVKKDFWEKE